MASPFILSKDFNGNTTDSGFGRNYTKDNWTASIAASTDTVLTVPNIVAPNYITAANVPTVLAIIRISNPLGPVPALFIAVNSIATLPVGAAFAQSNSFMSSFVGEAIQAKVGDEIHMICASPIDVSVSFYPLPLQ